MANPRQYQIMNYSHIHARLQGYPLKDICYPSINDVLCAKDLSAKRHIGNFNWRRMVLANKRLYLSLPKLQKSSVPISIVMAVRENDPPGRFLRKDKRTNLWYDIGDEKAIFKTGQALRENAPRLRDEIIKERRKEQEKKNKKTNAENFSPSGCPVVIPPSLPCNGLDLQSVTENVQSPLISNNDLSAVDSQTYTFMFNPSFVVPTNMFDIKTKSPSSQVSHSRTALHKTKKDDRKQKMIKDTEATSISGCADDTKTVINESAASHHDDDEHPSSLAIGIDTGTEIDQDEDNDVDVVGSLEPTTTNKTKGFGTTQIPSSSGVELSVMNDSTTTTTRPTATLLPPFITHPLSSSSPHRDTDNIRALTTEGNVNNVTYRRAKRSLPNNNLHRNESQMPAGSITRRRPTTTTSSSPTLIVSSSSLALCGVIVDTVVVASNDNKSPTYDQETGKEHKQDNDNNKKSAYSPAAAIIPPLSDHHYQPHKKRKRRSSMTLLSPPLPTIIMTKQDSETATKDNSYSPSPKKMTPTTTATPLLSTPPFIMLPKLSQTVSLSSSSIPDAVPSTAALQHFVDASEEIPATTTTRNNSSNNSEGLSTLSSPPYQSDESAMFGSSSSLTMMNKNLQPLSPSLRERSVVLSLLSMMRGHR